MTAPSDLQTAINAINWAQTTGLVTTSQVQALFNQIVQIFTGGVPVTGLTGLGSGVETFLATPTSANLAAAVTDETGTGALVFATSPAFAGSVLTNAAAGGVGYTTGAGGTVSQSTSKSTGVTLNKLSGAITMNNAALAAATIVSFTLTDSSIAATDVLVLNHDSGGTIGSYGLNASTAAGSAVIYVRNNTAGSLSEAIVISFAVIKGATS